MESWSQGALLLLACYLVWLAAATWRHRRRRAPSGPGDHHAIPLLLVVRDIDGQVEGLVNLLRCRLAAQSPPEVPVWIINAGSTDLTGSILDRLCGRDSRFQLLHLPRGRMQCAVDAGLSHFSPAVPLVLVCDLRRPAEAADCAAVVAASAGALSAANKVARGGLERRDPPQPTQTASDSATQAPDATKLEAAISRTSD